MQYNLVPLNSMAGQEGNCRCGIILGHALQSTDFGHTINYRLAAWERELKNLV